MYFQIAKCIFLKLDKVFYKLQNVFVWNYKMYFSKLENSFIQITECICPNCKIYLSQPLWSEAWIASQARKFCNWANNFSNPEITSNKKNSMLCKILQNFVFSLTVGIKSLEKKRHLVLWLWKCRAEKTHQGNCGHRTQEFHSPMSCKNIYEI